MSSVDLSWLINQAATFLVVLVVVLVVVVELCEQALDIAQPKKDKWISSPSHFSSFFTVYLLLKCCFVAS